MDPVTRRRHNLVENIPPGPNAWKLARAARNRLVAQVDEGRNARTGATVDQLLERYLNQIDIAPSTLHLYRRYVANHISPVLGQIKVGDVDADVLDSFYASLRRCRPAGWLSEMASVVRAAFGSSPASPPAETPSTSCRQSSRQCVRTTRPSARGSLSGAPCRDHRFAVSSC
jgi:hypothetical protein